MKFPRRTFLHAAVGAAVLPAVARFARAQAYPARPVRLVVGFPPGGSAEIVLHIQNFRDRPQSHRIAIGRRQQYRHRGGRAPKLTATPCWPSA
jgi:hypothetical protein